MEILYLYPQRPVDCNFSAATSPKLWRAIKV